MGLTGRSDATALEPLLTTYFEHFATKISCYADLRVCVRRCAHPPIVAVN